MIRAKITLEGLDKALAQLGRIKLNVKDYEPLLVDAGEYLMNFFAVTVFNTEGSAYGSRWTPLNARYAKQKLKRWGPRPILVASGKMRNSYRLIISSNYLIIQNEARNKNGEYYGGAHQNGTGRVPQRIMMKFQDPQMNQVAKIVTNRLNTMIRNSI